MATNKKYSRKRNIKVILQGTVKTLQSFALKSINLKQLINVISITQ